jgi:hypothetical protein
MRSPISEIRIRRRFAFQPPWRKMKGGLEIEILALEKLRKDSSGCVPSAPPFH